MKEHLIAAFREALIKQGSSHFISAIRPENDESVRASGKTVLKTKKHKYEGRRIL